MMKRFALIAFVLFGTACSDPADSDGGTAAGAGGTLTGGSGGTVSGVGGSSGTTTGGGGATSGGAGGSGGSSGSGGTGPGGEAECGPDFEIEAGFAHCIDFEDYEVPPKSLELVTSMVAGQPYAVTVEVTGDATPTVALWGTNAECGEALEILLPAQALPQGEYCFELAPTAAHTHLVMELTGFVNGGGTIVNHLCPNGECL
jgi:hypothetical protein